MSVAVPAQYQGLINQAAQQTGLPVEVVAAQIQYESSFNPNAVSPTGAQGIAQFEPGTWAQYGSGSPFDPTAAMAAYAKFMSDLLHQFNGNVTDALAAYNAGAGDLPAGMGYAQHILSVAGSPGGITITPGSGGSSSSSGSPNATDAGSGGGSWWSILFPWLGSDPISSLLGNNGLAGVIGSGLEQGIMRGFLDILIQLWNKVAKPFFWVFEIIAGMVVMNVSIEILLATSKVGGAARQVSGMLPGPVGSVARGAELVMGGKGAVQSKRPRGTSTPARAQDRPAPPDAARPLPASDGTAPQRPVRAAGSDRGIRRSAPKTNPAPENEPRSTASPSQKRYRAAANKVNREAEGAPAPRRRPARARPKARL